MRISLIHAILVFLTILNSVSALANVVGEDLAGVFGHDVDAVKAEFSKPLPEEHSDMLKDEFVKSFGIIKAELSRAILITVKLIENQLGLLISRLWHMPEGDARMSFGIIKAKLSRAILITVNLIKNYLGLFISHLWDMSQGAAQMSFVFIKDKLSHAVPIAVNLIENLLGLLISGLWHMLQGAARMSFGFIKAKLSWAILIFVALLLTVALLIVALFLIPGIRRPLLRILGFGPSGIVKGSVAAWVQGAAIMKGSLFAVLQSAGMK